MKRLTTKEALRLYKHESLHNLGSEANKFRQAIHGNRVVTFVIDRNINYTNVCINRCKFCAFFRDKDSPEAYLLSHQEIFKKIQETIALGGTQLLLQGGINPELGLDYYCDLFREIKNRFTINIHGLSPTEMVYLSNRHGISIKETLQRLREAGLDSIPGGGAEILSDRVRRAISPNKILSSQWLEVMETAHSIGMKTTATMMFGSIEGPEEVIEHLELIRSLQDRTGGFTAFIPWSFQPHNTQLSKEVSILPVTAVDYLRVLSISRLYLDNVPNIQASWVTQGLKLAQVALLFGANDMGSTMIEENVVRAAGASYRASIGEIVDTVKKAGFRPVQRDTYYRPIKEF